MKKMISFWLTAMMLATTLIIGARAEDIADPATVLDETVVCEMCDQHDHGFEDANSIVDEIADGNITDESFNIEAMAYCNHSWTYYDITSSSHTRRCSICGNTYPGISHNSRTVPCNQSYSCECGYTISSIPHNTQWRAISSSQHQLVCTNSYCGYAIGSSIASCSFNYTTSPTVIGGVHKGYGTCSTCGNFTYYPVYDELCIGSGCPYCH